MKYSIEKKAGESAYLQLYRQLKNDIIRGVFPVGTRLPSKRQLATELELSLVTVEHALALLVDEGYAVSRERSGIYSSFGGASVVPPRATMETMSLPSTAEDFPFSSLARIMRRVLSEYGERILTRSPNFGCGELRTEIAAYLARSRDIQVPPDQIIVGSGSEYLYSMIIQLLGRNRLYAREDPCYDTIRRVYDANGVRCEGIPMSADGVDSDSLAQSHATVLHVTPYQSYPSGVSATAARRHEYVSWARSRDAYLVEDDYGAELAVSTRQVETLFSLAPERVIYLNSFSKTFAPSMRMGYMVLPRKLLEPYKERLGFYSCAVPVYEQLVLAEFIRSGELERSINRRRRKLRELR